MGKADPEGQLVEESFDEKVSRYKADLIMSALTRSGGRITQAARLLGMTHSRLGWMLQHEHKNLLPERKPARTRRKSIIKTQTGRKKGIVKTDCRVKKRLPGEKLSEFAEGLLPANLPAEIREEARQAIILDLLTKKVSVEALKDPRLIRRYVRAAYGLQDGYRFSSLDAPVNDGESTLGDLIAA